jgi:hypothetical protein
MRVVWLGRVAALDGGAANKHAGSAPWIDWRHKASESFYGVTNRFQILAIVFKGQYRGKGQMDERWAGPSVPPHYIAVLGRIIRNIKARDSEKLGDETQWRDKSINCHQLSIHGH